MSVNERVAFYPIESGPSDVTKIRSATKKKPPTKMHPMYHLWTGMIFILLYARPEKYDTWFVSKSICRWDQVERSSEKNSRDERELII